MGKRAKRRFRGARHPESNISSIASALFPFQSRDKHLISDLAAYDLHSFVVMLAIMGLAAVAMFPISWRDVYVVGAVILALGWPWNAAVNAKRPPGPEPTPPAPPPPPPPAGTLTLPQSESAHHPLRMATATRRLPPGLQVAVPHAVRQTLESLLHQVGRIHTPQAYSAALGFGVLAAPCRLVEIYARWRYPWADYPLAVFGFLIDGLLAGSIFGGIAGAASAFRNRAFHSRFRIDP